MTGSPSQNQSCPVNISVCTGKHRNPKRLVTNRVIKIGFDYSFYFKPLTTTMITPSKQLIEYENSNNNTPKWEPKQHEFNDAIAKLPALDKFDLATLILVAPYGDWRFALELESNRRIAKNNWNLTCDNPPTYS